MSTSCSSGPRDAGHGDLATNLAMVLAKRERANPRKTAERVLEELRLSPGLVARTEIAGPGLHQLLAGRRLSSRRPTGGSSPQGAAYGRATSGAGLKVNVEFVSANPTGPLHVGHGRGAALGDAIASLLEWTGHAVTREFYINDAGVQIDRLAESLWARDPRGGRPPGRHSRGRLPRRVPRARTPARCSRARGPGFADLPAADGAAPRARASRSGSSGRSRTATLADFGVQFDVHVLGAGDLRLGPGRARARAAGAQRGLTYEADGALWLRTTAVRRRQGPRAAEDATAPSPISCPTSPITSTSTTAASTARSTSGAPTTTATSRGCAPCSQALGYPPEFFDVALVQLVKVVRGGEEVKMSKRSGEFVTLRDLYEEVGVDAARYFFLMRKGASPLDFDVDLAKRQTDENPVFYVQMAHARLSGIFRTAERDAGERHRRARSRARCPAPQDAELLKKLVTFPEVVEKAAREREPHRITVFLHELATVVHGWYHHTRAVGAPEGPATEQARLLLARAARIVLANALDPAGHLRPGPDVT